MRTVSHTCKCGTPFTGHRALKYCSDECRKAAIKSQNAEYERRTKRWPYKYRIKNQLELALDDVRLQVYKEPS